MTPELAARWVAFVARRPLEDVYPVLEGMSLQGLVKLGRWLEANPLFNPPGSKVRLHRAICQCGCGQWFERQYRTAKPLYVNNSHKTAAWRRRRKNGG